MAPPDTSSRDRQEIDDLHRSLPSATHYEVLGVDRSASADAILRAHRARTQRFSPESLAAPLTNAYMQRLEAVQEALDTALAVLGDPVRRYLYDQDLDQRGRPNPSPSLQGGASSKGTPLPGALQSPLLAQSSSALKRTPPPGSLQSPPGARPASGVSSPTTPRAPTPPGGFRAPAPPSPITPRAPTPPPTEPLGVLQPEARPTPASLAAPGASQNPPPRFKQTGPQPIGARRDEAPSGSSSSSHPPAAAADGNERVAALEAQVSTLQGEVATLLTEVERLAVSIQLTIARQLEPDGIKPEQLVSAGQALVSSRVAIATLLARREEAAGRWEAASALWQRASRARPTDVLLLVNAANALRKAGTDMAAAEALARQAIAVDPDNADAHSALAVIEARRRPAT